MRRLVSLLIAWALVLGAPLSYAPSALGQVSVDSTKTRFAGIGSSTWSAKPAASAVPSGAVVFVSDVGENGSFFQSNGTRWRAQNGTASLKTRTTATSGIANTDTVVLQALLPAGSWQVGDTVRVWVSLSKSGTTDTLVLNARVGTAGTTADTSVTGSQTFLSAAAQSGGYDLEFMLVSATSVQRTGSPGSGPATVGSSASAVSAPVTISDSTANPLYFSISIASSGTTNTVGVISGRIQLVTP